MRREVELLFDTIVREDHNILELLTADYTFVNEAARQALRHQEHLRQSVPTSATRAGHGSATGTAGQGRFPGDDIEAGTHLAGHAR
jgi:hypothetical protein